MGNQWSLHHMIVWCKHQYSWWYSVYLSDMYNFLRVPGVPAKKRKGKHMEQGRRKKRRKPTEDELGAAVAKLLKGKLAPDWACREVLGLTADPTPGEISCGLHNACHVWSKSDHTVADWGKMLAAITSAAVLLGVPHS